MELVEGLGRLGRREDLRALLARVEAGPRSSLRSQALVQAHLWLGEPERALAAAREAVAERGEADVGLLRIAFTATGDFTAAEAAARRDSRAHPGQARLAVNVARAQIGQGLLHEALRTVDGAATDGIRTSPSDAPGAQEAGYRFTRAMLIAAGGDPAAVSREAVRIAAVDRTTYVGPLAVALALLGDDEHAAALAVEAPESAREAVGAFASARAGNASSAVARLAALESRDPSPAGEIVPAYLMAEIASAAGDHREALAAVGRFRRLPPGGTWFPWAYLRSALIAARAHHALGDDAAARREVNRLLANLARANRDLPLLRDARVLRARL